MKYIFLLGTLVWLMGCSEADNVEPSGSKDIWFDSTIGLSVQEAEFCQKFHEETGTYLLFNDTLRRESLGTDRYGNEVYFTETVDFSWTSLTDMSSTKYLFHYLKAGERIEAGEFLRDKILSRFEPGIRPFSILLVDTISSWSKGYSDYADYTVQEADIPYFIGFRCCAFAIHDWQNMAEDKKETLADFVSLRLVVSALNRYSGELADAFYAYGQDYYGKYTFSLPVGMNYRDVGFLAVASNGYQLQSKKEDMEMFVELCFYSTDKEVEVAYSDYPVILKKYELMKEMLVDMGYHLNN